MPKISFSKNYSPIEVEENANLMQSLLQHGRPVASSCGGDGICAKCKIEIVSGQQNLSPASKFEVERIRINDISSHYRLSCQCHVLGNITVNADYW